MFYHFRNLGLIFCFVFGALAKVTVEVNRDITVKPTPSPLTNDADRVDVTLNCTGSRSDLSYYIKNFVSWTFIPSTDKELRLTNGFYASPNASHLFRGPEARFKLAFRSVEAGHAFDMSITGVSSADNGIYRCSLKDKDSQVIDSKDVRLTVVNPVETVAVELYGAQKNFIAKSRSPVIQNAQPLNITSGEYMVRCVTSGSNPEPVMNLFLNELKTFVSVSTKEDNSTEFKSYVGALEVKNLTISSHSARQTLVCTANIPGNFYTSSSAGIALSVRFSKPFFLCDNATAALSDSKCKLKCNLTDEGQTSALTCESTSWLLGTTGQSIGYEQRWTDPNEDYGIMESFCKKTKGGLIVILDIFTINSKIFEETFFIVYGSGENAHRHPVNVHDVTSIRSSTPHGITKTHPVTNETPANEAVIFSAFALPVCLLVTVIVNILTSL